MKNSVCVVIPMYNEEIIAKKSVQAVLNEIKKIKNKNVGFIVVDGASKDKTKKILTNLKKTHKDRLNVVNLSKNTGYGGALRSGTKEAKKTGFDFVLYMDSDLTNSPKDIARFVKKASSSVDCVKATRYSEGGRISGVPLYRQYLSIIANNFARICFGVGITDCTNGFRMVRISALDKLILKEKGFSSIVEELYQLKKIGAKFDNVPVVLTARKDTTTHFSYSLQTIINYTKYTLKAAFV